MLHDPARHEPCIDTPWDAAAARAAVERIAGRMQDEFVPGRGWPAHPVDVRCGDDPWAKASAELYFGGAGAAWALRRLQALGATSLRPAFAAAFPAFVETLPGRICAELADDPATRRAYLIGEPGVRLLQFAQRPDPATADRLAELVEANLDHPARDLMLGAPGSMLAARFLHAHTGDERWAALFRRGARVLWSQLAWSDEHRCAYWPQLLFGVQASYLDAVHGVVATASVLAGGRALLAADEWTAWQACIETTVARNAIWEDGRASWRCELLEPPDEPQKRLMQFCHGAPGFVTCLAGWPGTALDALLVAAGEATWHAGPLRKGANLCHGTAGNGHAFLALHARTGDPLWLHRARRFAMHAIAQVEAGWAERGRGHASLWTGDAGVALYLHDCVRGCGGFPTLDVFFDDTSAEA